MYFPVDFIIYTYQCLNVNGITDTIDSILDIFCIEVLLKS